MVNTSSSCRSLSHLFLEDPPLMDGRHTIIINQPNFPELN